MKYMLTIYGNVTSEQVAAMRDDERKQLYAAWGAVNQTPGMTPGMELDDPATGTTVRVQDGQTLTTDGPFVEIKEALGGCIILEADDLDAAIEIAARIPAAPDGRRGRGASAGGRALIEQAFREQWGRVLASLIGFLGDFDLAEEAARRRSRSPRCAGLGRDADQPRRRWLATTARNRAIDRIRRERTLPAKTRLLETSPEPWRTTDGRDHVPGRAARADLHLLPSGARRPRRRWR